MAHYTGSHIAVVVAIAQPRGEHMDIVLSKERVQNMLVRLENQPAARQRHAQMPSAKDATKLAELVVTLQAVLDERLTDQAQTAGIRLAEGGMITDHKALVQLLRGIHSDAPKKEIAARHNSTKQVGGRGAKS